MAKDDYHVIVFRMLQYLYAQLKKGEPVDREKLSNHGEICQINMRYWTYIIESMQEQELIRGLHWDGARADGDDIWEQLGQIEITPKGIDLLADNNMQSRVGEILQGVVKLLPGL